MISKKLPHVTQFPTPLKPHREHLTHDEKIEGIAKRFAEIMEILGLDLNDSSLKDTPKRVAEMYVNEVFSGLLPENFPEISLVDDTFGEQEGRIVLVKDIEVTSFCEHHFVPMSGSAHVAYLPRGKIIGLSKINRIVRYFCQRPQLQERLTAQIADCLSNVLQTPHVAVYINAQHQCVSARGISDTQSSTTTYVFLGDFLKHSTAREEFFFSINN